MSAMTAAGPTARTKAKQIPLSIDRGSPIPLYHQLSEQLIKAVQDGVLQPGETFENEVSLAERLDMSRPTVRRSIAELVTRGLLIRRRGVGTTVARAAVHRRNELSSHYEDPAANGQRPTTRVLRMDLRVFNKRAARELQLDSRKPLVYLERLRMVDGSPLALLKNWLPPEFGAISVAELEFRGLYELLRAHGATPAVAHQSVGSRPAVPEERRLLELGPFDPVLTMTRRAYDAAGAPVEFGDHSYRADRYKFDVTVHAL